MSTTTQRSSNVRASMLLVLTGIVVLLASKGSNAKPDENPPFTGSSLTPPPIGPNIPVDYQLRVGPIEGLTTGWHLMLPEMPLPSAIMQLFHYSVPPDVSVRWENAIEIARDEWGSTAFCPLLPGGRPQAINVYLMDADGAEWTASSTITVLEAPIESIEISQPQVWVDEIVIDEDLSEDELNQVTMQYFFRENSIAALTDLGDGWYRTSVTRDVYVSVEVTPPEFAPLIEWRIDGDARTLGATSVLQVTEIGNFQIDAGPPQNAEGFGLETYRVTITSHISDVDNVPEGEPIVFTAETDPPGYEDEITWLSSTLYGTAQPVLGFGPVFIAEFNDTWGPWPQDPDIDFQWLGVRADNTAFNQDNKRCDVPEDCEDCGAVGANSMTVTEAELQDDDCNDSDDCGITLAPLANTQTLNIETCSNKETCQIEFRVMADRDIRSDPCPDNFTEISGGGDPNVTAANFCDMVNGFWNGGSGDGGGDCFRIVPGGIIYGHAACVENHEDAHVLEYEELLAAELEMLKAQDSMAPIDITGDPPMPTCEQAKADRTEDITADVNMAYQDTTTAWALQGEGMNGWAAEFPCARDVARSICQWAEDDPVIDVDACTTCADGSLGVVYTDPE